MPLQEIQCKPHKKTLGKILVGLCIAAVWLAIAAESSANCIKTVRWSEDRPYTWQDQAGELRGIYIEFARELMGRMGCKPKFVQLPWARALAELEAGRLDALFGAFTDAKRERYAHFSNPINRSPNLLFITNAAADQYKLQALADVIGTNFRLGTQIGVNYNGDFEKLYNNEAFNQRLVRINNRQGGWKMMAANRLDGLIADEVTALLELQALGLLHQIHKSTVEISGQAAAVAFSKESISEEFVQNFNLHLQEMKSDGSYKILLEHYLPCDIDIEHLGCH